MISGLQKRTVPTFIHASGLICLSCNDKLYWDQGGRNIGKTNSTTTSVQRWAPADLWLTPYLIGGPHPEVRRCGTRSRSTQGGSLMFWVEARVFEHKAFHKKSYNGSTGRDNLSLNWSLWGLWVAGAARGQKIQTVRNGAGDGVTHLKNLRTEMNQGFGPHRKSQKHSHPVWSQSDRLKCYSSPIYYLFASPIVLIITGRPVKMLYRRSVISAHSLFYVCSLKD